MKALCSAKTWAQREFGGAHLGDRRRTERLVEVAAALAKTPLGTLPGSFDSWAELKAAYRLFSGEGVTFERISRPHWERTRESCQGSGEYFMIEDSTVLDFTAHALGTQGLGQVGNEAGLGMNLHTTLALRVEGWDSSHEPQVLVAGVLNQQCWIRHDPPRRKTEPKLKRLQRDRESQRWAAVYASSGCLPSEGKWTHIADREADIYEVFEKCQKSGVDFVIRAQQPRVLHGEAGSVLEAVARSPLIETFTVDLRARPGQAARRAELEVRTTRVTLRPPQRPGGRSEPFTVNVVEAREIHAPEGVEPILWVLLTTWPVETFEQAMRVIKAYTQRWLIEEYHKALKSGAKIEASQLSRAQRLQALLGVLAVVAVRLLQTKLFAASKPDERITFDPVGPEALTILETRYGKPGEGWTYRSLFVAIARLGGFLARKGDRDPGWITIWRGWQRLMLMAEGYSLAEQRT